MGFFTPSFEKPGKGVEKDAPKKRSFFLFFDIYFRKFWHLLRLNLLYALTMLPTFIIVFLLSGLISGTVFSMDGVQETIQNLAQQAADSIGDPETFAYQESTLIVTFDLFFRFVISFLFVIFWGMGPASAGFTYVLRNYAREEHAWVWADFKDAIKDNYKQALVVFLVDVLAFVLFYTAFLVYGRMPGMIGALRYVMMVILLIYTLMHFYLYPLMVTFELKLKDLYKNSLILALGELPSNLLVFVILLALHLSAVYACLAFGGAYGILLLFILLILELVLLLSFSGLLINFNVQPKLKLLIEQNRKTDD